MEPTAEACAPTKVCARNYINLDHYPIDRGSAQSYAAVLADARSQLARDGCCVLRDFIRPRMIPVLAAEADSVAGAAYRSCNRTNAYFSQDDPDLPGDDPRRRFYDRSNAFVPADNFGPGSGLRTIYEYQPFQDFIREALQVDSFYPYADPLADVIINVVEEGEGFPWHFDTNNFTVTLAIQNGEGGGTFEYVPDLRTPQDECFEAVRDVLDGKSAAVRSLPLTPGDLQIFKGRYSLHRVTPVTGALPRYVGIFSFVETEGMVGSVERTRQLYGRVLPVHYENAGRRDDLLKD